MDGRYRNCSAAGDVASQKWASPNEKEPQVGRGKVQSDTEITEGGDDVGFLVIWLGVV